ncbi:MAG: pentapeptide repeat-containing protein, partial [Candidatus Eremiobacterota bacterium]
TRVAGRVDQVDFRGATAREEVRFEDCVMEGPLLAQGARFEGPVVFTRCCFREVSFEAATFLAPVQIRDCRFEGRTDLSGATFSDELRIARSRFRGDLTLSNAEFRSSLEMEQCQVRGAARLPDTLCHGWADFSGSSFERADFFRARFRSGVEFREASFRRSFSFAETEVARGAIFREARFGGRADFRKARVGECLDLVRVRFRRGASLARAACGSDLHLQESVWSGPGQLSGVRVGNDLRLERALFRAPLRLDEAVVEGRMNLAGVRCRERVDVDRAVVHSLDLSGAECMEEVSVTSLIAGDVDLQGARFSRDLRLEDCRMRRLRLDHCRVENTLDCSGMELEEELACRDARVGLLHLFYSQVRGKLAGTRRRDPARGEEEFSFLARCFQSRSRYDDMDEAMLMERRMARRRRRAESPLLAVPGFLEWLLVDLVCGYGVRPFRILAASAAVVLLFGLIFWAGSQSLSSGLWMSMTAFVSPDRSLDLSFPRSALAESLVGIFLTALFIGTLTRKLAR